MANRTCSGLKRGLVSPKPSCPCSLQPQAHSKPLAVRANEWLAPQQTPWHCQVSHGVCHMIRQGNILQLIPILKPKKWWCDISKVICTYMIDRRKLVDISDMIHRWSNENLRLSHTSPTNDCFFHPVFLGSLFGFIEYVTMDDETSIYFSYFTPRSYGATNFQVSKVFVPPSSISISEITI